MGLGNEAEERLQHVAADSDDHHQGGSGLNEGHHDPQEQRALVARFEDAKQDEDRHDGEILEQQDRKAGSPDAGRQSLLYRQQLDDDRGGRKAKGGSDDECDGGRLSELICNKPDEDRGNEDLRTAKSEDQAAHRRQAFEGKLEADDEQQEDDAPFGKF